MGGTGNRALLTLHKCYAAMICWKTLFAYNFFTFSNIGLWPGAPYISSPEVSVKAFNKVSLKCLAGVKPSDCYNNELQWRFSNSSRPLKSGEKYEIQKRRTKTKCRTDFMITIFNVTYADEGKYSCHWLCEKDDPSVFRSSTIQLKVVTGMNNYVIISSAFSKERGRQKDKCWENVN